MKRRGSVIQPSLWHGESAATPVSLAFDTLEKGLIGLGQIDWSFRESTGRDLTHALHPWPAKFVSDIPAAAIALLSKPGDVVLDPFCGCGTTAIEAIQAGRGYIMTDVNSLAVKITQGKCEVPNSDEARRIVEWSLNLELQEPRDELLKLAPPIPNLSYWFDEPVLCQLAYLLKEIRSLNVCKDFLETVFSSIIVGVSHQESETRYRRVERDISANDVLVRFRKKLRTGLVMGEALAAKKSNILMRQYLVCDARKLRQFLPDKCAQLAVFSPPYPNSFDYHLYHRFRMFWLGSDPRSVKHDEIGAHLRYQPDETEWLNDMKLAFAEISHCLAIGKYALCVVGDGIARGRTIPSGDLLWSAADSCGLRPVWRTRRQVAITHKAFNLSDSRLSEEDIMVFQK